MDSTDCLILPGMTIDVGGTIPGQIASVDVDIGSVVQKGQVIASLRTEVQEAVLALASLRATNSAPIDAARARLAYEVTELARSEKLREKGVATDADSEERRTAHEIRKRELEEAQLEFQLARLDLVRAEAELEIRRIRAPIDGIVADRHLDPGEYLRDDGKVVTIVSLDPLSVEVFLPQQAYRTITPGQQVRIRPELDDHPLVATVKAVDSVVDAASATFRVRLELPNRDRSIVSGIRCVATFD
ncbi:MAG: efflux RND transporter periplasmic adaptor subunit [Pseudomonadota bacterium]|jgi:RND family efflux transporter MFP subunit